MLRSVVDHPAAAAEWLLSVCSALSSSHSRLGTLALIVTHLIIVGGEDVCQLALKAGQAVAAADPCQVGDPPVSLQMAKVQLPLPFVSM